MSSIRHDKFVAIQKERCETVMELPLLCDTRWVCKLKADKTFKDRFESVMLTLHFFTQSKKPRERVEAKGLITQLMNISNAFMLHLFEKLLLLTNCVSTYCQSKDATMSAACALVDSTISALVAMISDDSVDKLYSDVVSFCGKVGIVIADDLASSTLTANASDVHSVAVSGRKKRVPALSVKFNDSVVLTTVGHREVVPTTDTQCTSADSPAVSSDCKATLRKYSFEILDRMQSELKNRFCHSKPILLSCDTLNPTTSVFLKYEVMQPLAEAYSYLGIDSQKLQSQVYCCKKYV